MEWLELVRHAADSAMRSMMGMRSRFVLRRAPLVKQSPPNIPIDLKFSPRAIVQQRPAHFEDRYIVSESKQMVDDAFLSLRRSLFDDCDAQTALARRQQGGRMIFREQGKTSEGRPFMFFKPFNDFGWLIERSGAGWRISRAEKIVSQQIFLRGNGDPWDIVLLYADPKGEGAIRVKSQKFGNTLMSLPVYEQRMRTAFGIELLGPAH